MIQKKGAKEVFAESLRELAEGKNIGKITVQEIVDNCGYSMATFYRHFTDKYDLIAWDYTRNVERIMGQIGEGMTWEDSLLVGAKSFEENRAYLCNLFLHTSGHDYFVGYMTDINYKALRKFILESSSLEELDEMTQMYVRIYCLGTVCLTCEWILGKYDLSCEELALVFKNSLPAPLHEYLYRSDGEDEKRKGEEGK